MPIQLLLDEDVALRELMPEANETIRSVERGTLARVFPPNEATP